VSVDEDDWGRDEYELEMANQAVEEFQSERLQSYYRNHIDLAQKPFDLLDEARKAFDHSPSAALVLAMSSIEVGFKSMVLRPIMAGLVHNDSLSDFITDVFVTSTKHEDMLKVVNRVLKEYAAIDLQSLKLDKHVKTVWEELIQGQKIRNGVVHRAELRAKADAEMLIDLASYVWTVIFPRLLENIGLHTHDNRTVCIQDKSYCAHREEIDPALAAAERGGIKRSLVERLRATQSERS
jgi:hypothetical protein